MRLIDADALLDEIDRLNTWVVNDYGYCLEDRIVIECKQVERLIEEAPTVERPRGEWVFYAISAQSKTGSIDGILYKCSNCGAICNGKPRFCAGCYAEMRGEGE